MFALSHNPLLQHSVPEERLGLSLICLFLWPRGRTLSKLKSCYCSHLYIFLILVCFFYVHPDLLSYIDALADIASNSVVVLTRVKRILSMKTLVQGGGVIVL